MPQEKSSKSEMFTSEGTLRIAPRRRTPWVYQPKQPKLRSVCEIHKKNISHLVNLICRLEVSSLCYIQPVSESTAMQGQPYAVGCANSQAQSAVHARLLNTQNNEPEAEPFSAALSTGFHDFESHLLLKRPSQQQLRRFGKWRTRLSNKFSQYSSPRH